MLSEPFAARRSELQVFVITAHTLRAPPSSVGFLARDFLLLSPMKISMKQWQQHHQQKQQQKPEQKRNGWPDAKIERTGARRDLSSRFVDNDFIADKRYGGEKA